MKNAHEIRGDAAVIYIRCRGQTLECLIDAASLPRVDKFHGTWSGVSVLGGPVYVRMTTHDLKKRKTVYLHRVLLNAAEDIEVDHIDRDSLNNRLVNLRTVTHAQNLQNRGSVRGAKSPYRGVSWHSGAKKWMASFRIDNRLKHLGYFHDPLEAARAAKEARHKFMPFSGD